MEEIPTTGSSGEKKVDLNQLPGTETKKLESTTSSVFHYNFDADTLNGYFVDLIKEENMSAFKAENTDSSHDSLKGVDTKLFTPVHLRNPVTTFYKDYQENKGVKLLTVISRFGEFLLIPNKDFNAYLSMAHSLPIREMFTVNPANLKFASDFSHYHIFALSNNVWIFPYEAADHFRGWFDAINTK